MTLSRLELTDSSMERKAESRSQSGNFTRYFLPAIAYGVLIISLSSIPDLSPPLQSEYPIDKLIHFLEYAGFCYFVLRLCTRLFGSRANLLAITVSGIFVTLFAIGDEMYQRLIPGRSSDPFDVLADLSGAFVIISISIIKNRAKKRDN